MLKTSVIIEAVKNGATEAELTITDEQAAQIAAVLTENGSIDADTLTVIIPELPPAMAPMIAPALSGIPSQIPASVFNEALFTALSQTVEPYTTNDEVQKGIKQYGQGIQNEPRRMPRW